MAHLTLRVAWGDLTKNGRICQALPVTHPTLYSRELDSSMKKVAEDKLTGRGGAERAGCWQQRKGGAL